jgi:predicted nucleic acid-binding protein
MKRLFVDTSAWLAYANRNDRYHARVRAAIAGFHGRLVTSTHVFDETVTLASSRLGHRSAVLVGESLLDSQVVDLIRSSRTDERAAWELFAGRPDKAYSFTDCVSFVLMRRLALDEAATLDADFRREGFRVRPE